MIYHNPFEKLGYFFYLVSPNKTSFEHFEDVPNYINEAIPYIIMLLLFEQCYALHKNKMVRINDLITSNSQGMLEEIFKLLLKSLQFGGYIYVYNNWRIITLPWNSAWTWWMCFLGYDLAYYWLHRACHEINILWAAHQVHHSSEDYNLSTALRRSIVQDYLVSIFYLPIALAIPSSIFLAHVHFNLLYQFWLHTETIKSLGPLEYIFNTASHHRVHHGRNRYYIDKNYGGTLIIWDRIFGTFEPEGEKVVYGLTQPINRFEPFSIQFGHFVHIWKTFWDIKGFKNKLSVLFKGPGWKPGCSWHGNPEDIPDVKWPIEKYDPPLSLRKQIYLFIHFWISVLHHTIIIEKHKNFSQYFLWIGISYQLLTLISFGMLAEKRFYAPWIEFSRCILFFMFFYRIPFEFKLFLYMEILTTLVCIIYAGSIIFWVWNGITNKIYKFSCSKLHE